MHLDKGPLNDNFTMDHDESDGLGSDNSDASTIDSDTGSYSSDAVETESDEELSNSNNNEASTSAGSALNEVREASTLNEDDEEDEVVKAIIRSQNESANHPPAITTEDNVTDICFHPKRNIIAVANIVGDIYLYKYDNTKTETISTLELHLRGCRDVEFDEDGKTLFSTAKDLCIMLTDVETEKLTRLYENAHEAPVYTMTVIGEHMFASGDDDGTVKLWDVRRKESTPVFSIKMMEDYVSSIITNSEAKYLVCASGDGSLTTFNIPGKKLHLQSEEYDEELTSLGLFKSETKVLATTSKGKMYVYNWGEFGLHSDEFPSVNKKAMNCMIPITENIAITGGEDGMLRAISLFPHRHLGIVGQHKLSIEAIDVSNDGTLIASSTLFNEVAFWNVEYFETLDVNDRVKGGKQKQLKHNLPSSKVDNASNFFLDLC